ncbi:MAG: RsmE family RNA methyltransferase [Candidatus Aminicenantes bacterium]|nr:RsmE family RNA methyltransferase [Candidatus Aminicenantes bacterium]
MWSKKLKTYSNRIRLTSNRFFIPKKQIKKSSAVLVGSEHHHLSRVVRKKRGDHINLFTETGENYEARIEKINKSETLLTIWKIKTENKPETCIRLAPSLIKAKSLELILKKCTELGVSTFSPVISERTVVNISAKLDKKMKRWNRIVIQASKQCQRPCSPVIEKPVSLKKFLGDNRAEFAIFLDESKGESLKNLILCFHENKQSPPQDVIILLGPEGGWTEKEKQDIILHEYKAVNLGTNILRTETAAVACVSIISHFWCF